MRVEAASRLLFVDNHLEDFLRNRIELAHRMKRAGFEVHAAVPNTLGVGEIAREGICVHTFYLKRTSDQLFDELRCLASLFALYKRVAPTLVHHISLKPILYGGIAARLAAVPAVISTLTGLGHLFATHTKKTYFLQRIVASGLRFGFGHSNHRVIVQNADDYKYLFARCGMNIDRLALIKGSGINLSLYVPRPEMNGVPVVLMAARLLWSKGVGEFVAAAKTLRANGISARFMLVGEPDYGHPSAVPATTLQYWCDAGYVEWLGWRDDIPSLIAQSHIVCLPSTYGEGIPLILLEAAASGRPVVATDSTGCRDVVKHGQNGLLVPISDSKALATALTKLIENAPLRAAMGTRGREIAAAESSLDQIIEANLEVYRSALESLSCARQPPGI